MMMPEWRDAQSFKTELVSEGWLSPDTYCNYFCTPRDLPAVYLFLMYPPYAEGRCGFDRAIVAYVGMSRRLRTRLATHDVLREINTGDAWVMRWFKPTPANDLRETESHYIRRFNPPWNVVGKTRGVALQ